MTDKYSVLIRTFNSERTLPTVLASLKVQTVAPAQYVFVDSGSSDRTLAHVPPDAEIHRYAGSKFNFSESLNQGVAYVTHDFLLIISSHTFLQNHLAIEYALKLLQMDERIGAAYFADGRVRELGHEIVDGSNFDGFNGLHNTCALVRVSLLRERPFRPEVFSAEDQEWSGWYLRSKEGMIASILGGGMKCENPKGDSPTKKLNEYVAIAYFVNRKFMSWLHIFRLVFIAIKPRNHDHKQSRRFYLTLAARLAVCHFAQPRYQSRY